MTRAAGDGPNGLSVAARSSDESPAGEVDVGCVRTVAERQLADYRAGRPGSVFDEPAGTSMTLEEAYQLQIEVMRLRTAAGEEIAGYKVGCTGADVQSQLNVTGPISGFVFDSEVVQSPARLASRHFTNLAVEAELAVRLDSRLRPVAPIPVIELHNYLLRSHRPRLEEIVANNGLHAGVVLAGPAREQSPHTPGMLCLTIDGVAIENAELDPIRHALEALRWLSPHLRSLGLRLRPGQLILTGTPLSLVAVRPGTKIASTFGHLGAEAVVDT